MVSSNEHVRVTIISVLSRANRNQPHRLSPICCLTEALDLLPYLAACNNRLSNSFLNPNSPMTPS